VCANIQTIIRREPFQDLYQTLKERHKHLNSRVAQPWSTKVEDVKRHVWKVSSRDCSCFLFVGHYNNNSQILSRWTLAHPMTGYSRRICLLGDHRILPLPRF
jgi:hypothetical protein